jgi:hypothetical protein
MPYKSSLGAWNQSIYGPFTVTCYHLRRPSVPQEHCFSASFVTNIASWGEETDNYIQ